MAMTRSSGGKGRRGRRGRIVCPVDGPFYKSVRVSLAILPRTPSRDRIKKKNGGVQAAVLFHSIRFDAKMRLGLQPLPGSPRPQSPNEGTSHSIPPSPPSTSTTKSHSIPPVIISLAHWSSSLLSLAPTRSSPAEDRKIRGVSIRQPDP